MLWNTNSQTRRIFNWKQLLEDWNASLNMPPYVETVITNLKAAADPNSNSDFPLSHFLTFLNNEPEAITWFLYENIALRWMYGEVRLDYVKDLLELVDLESTFPEFPGSPGRSLTVRQFVESHLDSQELDQVELMPRLISTSQASSGIRRSPRLQARLQSWRQMADQARHQRQRQQTQQQQEPQVVFQWNSEPLRLADPLPEGSTASFESDAPNFATANIFFSRHPDNSKRDDVVFIRPSERYPDLYNYTYNDKDSKVKSITKEITKEQLLHRISLSLRATIEDQDPYKFVQVNFPGFPTLMRQPKLLDSYVREMIYDMVEELTRAWPVLV
jgi:hypothetical protein